MKKHLSILLLTALMLPLIAACGSNDGAAVPSETTDAPLTAESIPEETTEARLPSTLPDTSLDGYAMTFLGRFTVDTFNENGIYAPELNGEAVNDAVYERNRRVMDNYDCVIEYADRSGTDELPDALKKAVAAGDDLYQGVLYGAYHLAQLAPSNYFLDLSTLDELALDMPWWSGLMNEELSIGGRLYMTLNSFLFNAKVNLYHIMFNQKLAEDYGVPSAKLYEQARNGAWTLDRYTEFIKLAKEDLNGDGAYDHNDLWGCGAESYTAYAVAVGIDVYFVEKDSDGIPHLSVAGERNINGILDTLNFFADADHILITENIKGVDSVWNTGNAMMTDGKLLTMIGSLRSFIREMEDDYGVLPMPKRTEEQESYRHITTVYNAPVLALVSTSAEPDKTAFVCEALAYDSYYNTLPVFYDNFLNTKMVRDADSVEMLRIIHDSATFELSSLYILDKFVGPLNSAALNHKTDFASTVASSAPSAETKLDSVVEAILAQ